MMMTEDHINKYLFLKLLIGVFKIVIPKRGILTLPYDSTLSKKFQEDNLIYFLCFYFTDNRYVMKISS